MHSMDENSLFEIEQKVKWLIDLIQGLKDSKIRRKLYRNFLYILSTFEVVLLKIKKEDK